MEITIQEFADLLANEQADSQIDPTPPAAASMPITGNVIIRTVTHYFTGHVVGETSQWLLIDQAAWIADTGRWANALKSGKLNEVEPYPEEAVIRVGIGAIIDIAPWGHALPTEQK